MKSFLFFILTHKNSHLLFAKKPIENIRNCQTHSCSVCSSSRRILKYGAKIYVRSFLQVIYFLMDGKELLNPFSKICKESGFCFCFFCSKC